MFIQIFFVVMHILPITDSHHHHDGGHHELTSFPLLSSTSRLNNCSDCAANQTLVKDSLVEGCKDSVFPENCVKDLLIKNFTNNCHEKCTSKSSSITEPSVVLVAVGGLERGRGNNFF